MKYIVDITKPPIPPPAPPCRTFKEIGMFFPTRLETTESKALTDQYKEDNEAWRKYIQEYTVEANNSLHKQILNHLKQQQDNCSGNAVINFINQSPYCDQGE